MRVGLFITCLTDAFYPRAGIAMVLVLEHLGHTVEFPDAQTCCGQPMFNNGFHGDARALARRMIRVFEGFPAVVTPSGSCAAMVRERFGELLHGNAAEEAGARALAARTHEFVEFLVKVDRRDIAALATPHERSLAIHDACHLRSLGLAGETDRLLGGLPGVRCRPLDKAEQCCGFGGTFAAKFPEISGPMVADKVEAIRRAAPEAVVCADAGCAMNIAGACRRAGLATRFTTPAEVIAEALNLMPTEAAR